MERLLSRHSVRFEPGFAMCYNTNSQSQTYGSIPGELSFAANSRELERTRANSARTRQRFANTDSPPNSGERSAYSGERPAEFGGLSMLANRWRVRAEFARVRSSSREFARVRGERQFAGYTAKRTFHRYFYLPYRWKRFRWY